MRLILAVLATFLFVGCANATTCTWQGGTATWDHTNPASWSCGHFPVAGDGIVFDGTSGGGTVTVAAAVNGDTFQTITCGAFTGTLDFSANNPSITLTNAGGFNGSGTGARTIKMGSGTFTFTVTTAAAALFTMATTTNLGGTSDFSAATYVFSGSNAFIRGFSTGGLTYGTLTVATNAGGGGVNIVGANPTFATINFTGPGALGFPSGTTTTITNAFAFTGSSYTSPSLIEAASGGPLILGTIHASAASTMDKVAVRDLTFNTSAVTVTGYDLQGNTFSGGGGISAPASGGGQGIMGGGM